MTIDIKVYIIAGIILILCYLYTQLRATIDELYDVSRVYSDIKEAKNGIIVDNKHFYAISDNSIGKYDLETGKNIIRKTYKLDKLNDGLIDNNKLICVSGKINNNSIETFDQETLKHISSKKLHIKGILTWYDRYNGELYGVSAFSDDDIDKTRLHRFTESFIPVESWRFPDEVLMRIDPKSITGGFIKHGLVYVSCTDRSEIYKLQMVHNKEELKLLDIIKVAGNGDGIYHINDKIYTIDKVNNKIIEHTVRYDFD